MNYCYNFDMNIYNSFIYYSGGYTPTYQQYQNFANTLYNYQQNYIANQTIPQQQIQMPLPPQQIQMPLEQIQQPQQDQVEITQIQKHRVCIKGMGCKNIKCNDFHHPSKDLDILSASKK